MVARILIALGAGAALLVIAGGSLNASNFCFAQRRFLSEDELLAAAVADIPKLVELTQERGRSLLRYADKSTDFSNVTIVNYKDASDFMQNNPNCCRIGRFDGPREPLFPPDWWTVVSGYAAKIVTVNFKLRFLTPTGKESFQNDPFYVWIDSCGKIKPYA
ncbi:MULTISPECIES: hypothetical protein [unclassified Mesorhizobium]|nr:MULTISPECIES: hypothetical protein [unclassified Mesorhizobium]RUV46882.1 hypothetical protein EOB77_30320 [Mesorhizobium sp. M7A.F.Ca.MR.228.00.0.0]RUU73609.1 hypothetical protein EOC06_35750 [Mesorhizobium sp. M7A.F.Ca.MR.362.00.0.0]RUV18736.1 hypothetical protein EOB80_21700 [Mesorhizobium sp. M7A.F.Ca.MR.245.00.0.0]RWN94966.1 MAG: hypothetical protein EOS05_09145 [Mesorhizobium sp.]RWP88268.1 MAG: hypothetical protein EOR12_16265 [Mesorhizobium sp.]